MEMDREKMAPHVDDIIRAIGGKVEKKKIEEELENYIVTYRVNLETAKRSIVRKYGGKASALSVGTNRTLAELVLNEQSVDILCRVLTVNPKEIEVEGRKKSIYYGLVSDGTATLPYTAWETENFNAERGDVIRALSAYTNAKEWNGKPQLNFGTRTRILKESKDLIAQAPQERSVSKKFTVRELKPGVKNVSVAARILSVEKRDVTANGQPKTVYSGVLGDLTGQAQFSAWDDFGLRENDIVTVIGGYVTAWRGIPQLNFDASSKVEKTKDGTFPKLDEIINSPPVPIQEIAGTGGAVGASVRGIVVDVRPGSGLVFRCPQCKRVTNKNECKLHGRVDGTPDLRTKTVLDDGTSTLTVILNRELTEKILGKGMDECIALAKEAMDSNRIYDEIAARLITLPLLARGNITSDDFGLTMIASDVKPAEADIHREAQALLEKLE